LGFAGGLTWPGESERPANPPGVGWAYQQRVGGLVEVFDPAEMARAVRMIAHGDRARVVASRRCRPILLWPGWVEDGAAAEDRPIFQWLEGVLM
jgi:hypothetical protein